MDSVLCRTCLWIYILLKPIKGVHQLKNLTDLEKKNVIEAIDGIAKAVDDINEILLRNFAQLIKEMNESKKPLYAPTANQASTIDITPRCY